MWSHNAGSKKVDGNDLIKPCRHTDENGVKCSNRGGLLKGVKEELNRAILNYRDRIIENIDKNDELN